MTITKYFNTFLCLTIALTPSFDKNVTPIISQCRSKGCDQWQKKKFVLQTEVTEYLSAAICEEKPIQQVVNRCVFQVLTNPASNPAANTSPDL